MKPDNSWTLGSPGSLLYRIYDGLRQSLNQKLIDYLLLRALPHNNVRVLEAGSGPASGSSLFSKDPRVGVSLAVDFDMSALCEARLRDPKIKAVVADMYFLPFKSESFDLVWNNSTIDHLEVPLDSVREMGRVTLKNGYVFIGAPYLHGPLGFQKYIPATAIGIWIGRVFGEAELRRFAADAGLITRDVIKYFFLFFVGILMQKKDR